MTTQMTTDARVMKVDSSLGLVLGYAIICKQNGDDYYDLQGHHIPEEVMLAAATDFMQSARVAKEMHEGEPAGTVVFAFPLTKEIAGAFGITTTTTGLMIGMRPNASMLEKFADGTLTGFSIGGMAALQETESDA